MSAGADSQAYKRFGKTLDLTGRTAPKLNFKFSGDVEPDWDFVIVEARDVTTNPDSDAWTTLPEADTDGAGRRTSRLTTTETGASCPEGLASAADAPHPFLSHYWTDDVHAAGHAPARGTRSPAPPAAGRTGTSTCPPTRARRSTSASAWSPTGAPSDWVSGSMTSSSPTARRCSSPTTSRPASAAGPSARRPPAPTSRPTAGSGAPRSSRRAAWSPPTTRVYTGFGFEGINESARNEFMKRTLTHLGVLAAVAPSASRSRWAGRSTSRRTTPTPVPDAVAARPRPRRAGAGQGQAEGAAREREAQVEQDAAGQPQASGVSVRVNCAGDTGAVCRGTVKLVRGKTELGSQGSSPSRPARPPPSRSRLRKTRRATASASRPS